MAVSFVELELIRFGVLLVLVFRGALESSFVGIFGFNTPSHPISNTSFVMK